MRSIVILLLPALLAQLGGVASGPQVPSSLLLAASKPPWQFAAVLADAGVPAGFELMEQDRKAVHSPVDINRRQYVPMGDVAASFNRSHSDYRAVVSDGVLVVRPTTRPLTLLDRPALLSTVVVIPGLMRAAGAIFYGRSEVSGGVGGSGPPPSAECLEDDVFPVALDGTSRSTIALLNEVARQSSHVWYVIADSSQDRPRAVAFGFWHRAWRFTQSQMPSGR